MIPTYFVAASTRSSYASITSTTESAHKALGDDGMIVDSTIPFLIITFRANRTFTTVMNFQFLAFCFGSPIELNLLLTFLFVSLVESIGSPGLPGSTRLTSIPFYVAAGIPIPAYLFSKAIDDIPDIFKTLLNVTYPIILLGLVTQMKASWDKYILKT
jgi:Na+/H+-dicarboxylate symporter